MKATANAHCLAGGHEASQACERAGEVGHAAAAAVGGGVGGAKVGDVVAVAAFSAAGKRGDCEAGGFAGVTGAGCSRTEAAAKGAGWDTCAQLAPRLSSMPPSALVAASVVPVVEVFEVPAAAAAAVGVVIPLPTWPVVRSTVRTASLLEPKLPDTPATTELGEWGAEMLTGGEMIVVAGDEMIGIASRATSMASEEARAATAVGAANKKVLVAGSRKAAVDQRRSGSGCRVP